MLHGEYALCCLCDVQAHEGLISNMAQLKAALQAKEEELAAQAAALAEEREASKDQKRKLSLELADARGQLELQVSHACIAYCILPVQPVRL